MSNFNVVLLFVTVLWGINMLYSIKGIRRRFVYFFFQITLFTFVLSRPLIGALRGEHWWENASQRPEHIYFALSLFGITEISLWGGAFLCEKYLAFTKRSSNVQNMYEEKLFLKNLRTISMLVCILTMSFYLIQQFEPLLLIGSGNYLDYYTSFQSTLPGFFHTIASFMKYSLCIYLATLPAKKNSFVMLLLYVLSTIPSLLIGVRNPFMLSLLFSLTYYLLRDFLENKGKWFGKLEKILMCIATPIGLILMVVYSFIRSGSVLENSNPFFLLVDFFYGQGVTFDVLAIGYGYRVGVRGVCPVNFTFGGMIDYIYRGTIGQKIFGTEALTAGNSIFNAHNSNSFSHVFSYISLKEEYLAGKGRGSSYLIETYMDFGYIGVIVFSLILGAILILLVQGFGKKVLASTIILCSLTSIFFAPRAEATGWLTFIVTIQFWACIAGCYLAAYICTRFRIFERIFKRREASE